MRRGLRLAPAQITDGRGGIRDAAKNPDGGIRTRDAGNQTGIEMNWLLDGRRRDMYQGKHRSKKQSSSHKSSPGVIISNPVIRP